MSEYSTGASSFTIASHAILVIVLLMVFHGAQIIIAARGSFAVVASSAVFRWSVFSVFSSLIVERIYYIVARLLQPFGLDMWQAHPAPEMLSLAVAMSLFALSVSGQIALAETMVGALRNVAIKFAILTVAYAAIAAVLY